eukprot:m.761201 g.761201  ORF g.761201 m.761201 type:complete len:196 (-) comp23205_c1_seq4:2234-2821(-)
MPYRYSHVRGIARFGCVVCADGDVHVCIHIFMVSHRCGVAGVCVGCVSSVYNVGAHAGVWRCPRRAGQLMAMEHVFGASPIRTPRVDFPMGATHSGLADAAADMSEVISIHLLELKHQMASELNSCDAFKYPQAIADANNGAGNNARAPRPSVTGEGAKSFARTQPDTSNWKDYCYWFFSRAKARACAGIHSVGY